MGSIRLACLFCDREDGDGLDFVPSDWLDVDEVQSYEDSVEVDVSTVGGLLDAYWRLPRLPGDSLPPYR